MEAMTKFVDLAPNQRTYIANVRLQPNFTIAELAPTRSARKQLAHQAMLQAEASTGRTLLPQLESLKSKGLLTSYEVVAGTGALILNVPETRAGAAFQALQGVGELGRIVRNRLVTLDEAATPTAAPTPGVPEYNIDKVSAPKAWARGVTGEGIVVGIVDTGANTGHEALKRQYRGTQADGSQTHDYNFFDPVGKKKDAYDDHNHGSHVAGTSVGGTADMITGVAPGAKFIATKVFTSGGSGDTATILKGLAWMLAPTDANGQNPDATKAPDIVSNSWGNRSGTTLSYLDAWKAFEAAGIVPVVAAGNSGPGAKTIGAPGSYAQSISVGATDKDDKVARFSSRGPSPIKDANGNFLEKPDVSAPGVDVVSAGKTGNSYVKMSGTSMATPNVAGVIALLLSKHPTLTNEQVREVLHRSSVDLGSAGWDADFGNGRVDADAALTLADRLFTPPPVTPPTRALASA